ncbi:MAG: flagellar basal body P-ring protein FlgI [candidate division Zixibacteria bacterium]|nr:flagellar basal body P-ring protein FlgI [candidate division Zixibacteria bacterium]
MPNFVCTRFSIPSFMIAVMLLVLSFYTPEAQGAARIKDITRIHSDNETDLIGYGLVIGLDGTGDGKGAQFTMQSLANMMQRMGLTVDPEQLKVKNVAAVIVTSRLSSNNKMGDRVDVTVSSIGDASSLQGGTLLLTQLSSPDGDVHVSAQGPISIGGFNVQADNANKIINNYTLVGRVPAGGNVLHQLEVKQDSGELLLSLQSADYTTAARITQAINTRYGQTAYVDDAATVRIKIPDSLSLPNDRAMFISDIGSMQVDPDQTARVVINERTGTIVAGQNVTIAAAAIAHGNITVNIQATPIVSQPEPFSQGQTTVVSEYQVSVDNEKARVIHLQETVSLADIAAALNQIGAAPRDIIAIFEALRQAGALRAELIII